MLEKKKKKKRKFLSQQGVLDESVVAVQLEVLVDVAAVRAALVPALGRPALGAGEVAAGAAHHQAVAGVAVRQYVQPTRRVVP